MDEHISHGKKGEDIAATYLKKNGSAILFCNLREGSDEIDIVARSRDGTLCFVEVKTFFIEGIPDVDRLMPEDNFTPSKLSKLKRSAQMFAGKHPDLINDSRGWRIDGIAVLLFPNGSHDIRFYENIS